MRRFALSLWLQFPESSLPLLVGSEFQELARPLPSVGSVKLISGFRFKHGQHLHFDPQNPPPLCNLYVSMLQRLGLETDKFGTSTSTLTGLEFNPA